MKPLYPAPGTAPATLIHHSGRAQVPPELVVVEYGPDFYEEKKCRRVEELPPVPGEGRVLWIEMNGLGDVEAIRALGQKYDLHPLALEDTLNSGQRPKFDLYDQHAYLLAQMVYQQPESDEVEHEQVSIFFSRGLIISIQEEPDFDVFNPVRVRLKEGHGAIRKHGTDYLAYALFDAIVDHLFPVLEQLGASVEEMENALLERPDRECAQRIHDLKRCLMKLRRAVWPERDVVSAMLHDESGLITKETKIFLRDCYDHTVQVMDLIESYRDVASGLMEMYLSAVGMRTNEIMRVLTVISAIFIPLTFVAGLYGMNFDWDNGQKPLNMPELHWPHGYIGCLVIMGAIATTQYLIFKKKGWL